MPGIMTLTALDSLYASTLVYRTTRESKSAAPLGDARWCGPAAARYCEQLSVLEYQKCSAVDCESLCERSPLSGVCSGCFEQRRSCQQQVLARWEECGRCPPGSRCTPDVGLDPTRAGITRCCPEGQRPCVGACRPSRCSDREAFSSASCRCECVDPWIRSGDACVCPPKSCPPESPVLDADCDCRPCPAGTSFCSGECRHLDSDRNHCGSCGHACGPDQECCRGVCVSLFEGGRCGSCKADCASPFGCCEGTDGGHTCLDLRADPENCGACGNVCYDFDGKVCKGGACVCKPKYRPCGPHACCPPAWECRYEPGVGAICACDYDTCGPDRECCLEHETCCGDACVQLGTTTDCHACGNACIYADGIGAPEVGTCGPQRLCGCPAGFTGVALDAWGGHAACCPPGFPHLCADGRCHDTPC